MRCNCELVCEHESFEARFGELCVRAAWHGGKLAKRGGHPRFRRVILGVAGVSALLRSVI
jgi:hypothetical protein|eukprot:COSAG06_NODE_3617_length_5114_cov_3.076171_1_plen_60_part_00